MFDVLFDSAVNSLGPKRGTSREPGISAKERQARAEEERIKYFTQKFREAENRRPAEQSDWQKHIDERLPLR